MEPTMICGDFEELSGAYVLDALTPEERQEAEAHLAECPRCTRLAKELRAVVALLPLVIPQVDPPASLKERLLSAIRQESLDITSQPTQRVRSVQGGQNVRRKRQQSLVTRLLAVAAVLLFLLLGGVTGWDFSLQQQLASDYAYQQQLINTIAHIRATTYMIHGLASDQGATGELLYYRQQNITVLIMHGLPQTQGAHVYQGWLLRGKQPTSIGLLNVNNGSASLAFPGNITGYDVAAVSLEPGPTASKNAPKGQVVALGMLEHPAPGT